MLCLAAGATLAAADAAPAQRRLTVHGGVACDSCELRIERVASLGRITDGELVARSPAVVHDTQGRFIVSGMLPATAVLVYDREGVYQEAWGRAGDGPGEFRDVRSVHLLRGDSVLVVEFGRATVLDADGQYARTFTLPLRILDLELLYPTLWVASGAAASAESIGRPLHLLTSDGHLSMSFGDTPVLVSQPSASQRVIGVTPLGVWSGRPDRYELEFRTWDGTLQTLLDRDVGFFPDRDVEGAVSVEHEPPSPWLRDIFVDSTGLIWTQIRVADAGWRPGLPYSFSHMDRHYDTIVEVIDPESGALLGSKRLPGHGDGFTNDGLIVTQREGEAGIVVLDVFRAALMH